MLKAIASYPSSGTPVGTGNFVFDETPAGTINSTTGSDGNGVFTLATAPSPASSLDLVQTVIGTATVMIDGVHFNLSGLTITYTAGNFPFTGTTHRANYMIA